MASIALAEKLLQLVKTVNDTSSTASGQPSAWETKREIQRTCDQLVADVLGPREYTIQLSEACQESQALNFVTHYKVPDVIGDEQLALSELAEKIHVKAQYLSVVMSCLVGHGYFEEVGGFGTRVYKNNQFSDVLRSSNPFTLVDAVGLTSDEAFRAASRLTDAAHVEAKAPAINIAFGFDSTIFEWMSSPNEAWRGQRLGKAMQQLHGIANVHVPDDYEWNKLASPIVDVGGGIGALEMLLLKEDKNKHLQFVLFDLPKTAENARKAWSTHPASSQVNFAPGSFLEPTIEASGIPAGKPTYIIRHVLHDWADDDVVKILKLVKQALLSSPSGARLLLVEMLLWEKSSRFVRTTSMQLLALNNGITRTEGEMKALVERAGFEVVGIHRMRSVDSVMEVKVAN